MQEQQSFESCALDLGTKPPENSRVEKSQKTTSPEVMVHSMNSRPERSRCVRGDPYRQSESREDTNLKDFHYSGSFGISMPSSPHLQKTDHEVIRIEPVALYKEGFGTHSNTIDCERLTNSVRRKVEQHRELDQRQLLNEGLQQKGLFQLINMSFSQDDITVRSSQASEVDAGRRMMQLKQKNPHNTIVANDELMQSYKVYEDTIARTNQDYDTEAHPSRGLGASKFVAGNSQVNRQASKKTVGE